MDEFLTNLALCWFLLLAVIIIIYQSKRIGRLVNECGELRLEIVKRNDQLALSYVRNDSLRRQLVGDHNVG